MKKGLFNIVNGNEKKPRTLADVPCWEVRDDKARAIITLELDDTYIHHVDGCETSKEVWDQLITLFGARSKSSKFGLLIEFFKLEMKSSLTLELHESSSNTTCRNSS